MSTELEPWMASRILERNGVKKSPQVEKWIIDLLKSAREGDLFLPIADPSLLPPSLWSDGSDSKKPFVIEENRLYLQRNWALEKKTFEKLAQLRGRVVSSSFDPILYQAGLSGMKGRLQEAQEKALSAAFAEPFAIFTGGPGTGKTYTASAFIRLLASSKKGWFKVAAAAPTGKAAAHLEAALKGQGELPENLRMESTTLHRLLRLSPGRHRFLAEQTVDADLVVVDEASMLDLSLLLHLFSAIGPETRLLLLGDPDQLPPVESGSLFPELARRFGHRLSRSIRMGDGLLFSFATAINERNLVEIERLLKLNSDVKRASVDFSIEKRELLIEWLCGQLPSPLYEQEPDPRSALESYKKFRILGAVRQGLLGIDELNRLIARRYSSGVSEWTAMPILIGKNDLRQQLFNGTVGVLIRKKGQKMGKGYFESGEGIQVIPEGALPHFELGFCLSVHKSQGSEFDEVLALFQPGSERFGKEALYTAVTRAKKKVALAIDDATFLAMIRTT